MERNALLKKGNFNAVDVAKFIMAFCVISIHTYYNFFESAVANTVIGSVIIRFAVPFFFVASGFFFFRSIVFENGKIKKCPENRARLFNFLKRTFILYVLWAIIYFVFEAYTYIDASLPISALIKTYVVTFFTGGVARQFWYLNFIIYAIIVLFLLLRFIRIEIVGGIVGVVFLSFLYYYTYQVNFQTAFLADILPPLMDVRIDFIGRDFHIYLIYAALGFLFAGLLCVYLRDRLTKRLSGILALVSIILSITENVLMELFGKRPGGMTGTSYSFFLLPVALFGFIFLSKINLNGNPKIFSFLRNGSSFIYCSHMLIIIVFNFCTDRAFVDKPVLFPIICGLSLVLTLIFVPLSSKLKFLRKLY